MGVCGLEYLPSFPWRTQIHTDEWGVGGSGGGCGGLASRLRLLQDVLGTCPAPGLLPALKHNRRDTGFLFFFFSKSKSSDPHYKEKEERGGASGQ